MTADDAKATLSKSEMYDIRAILPGLEDPEYNLSNFQQGTLRGLYTDPETGRVDPFRAAHILNDGWSEFHRKFMRGFRRAWIHAAPVRRIDGEAFCLQMWRELGDTLRCWCAGNFVNSDGRPAFDMTPQQVIERVEYEGSR